MIFEVKIAIEQKEILIANPFTIFKIWKQKYNLAAKRVQIIMIKKMPKLGFSYICLVVILIHFFQKKDKDYYSQLFVKEREYIDKSKRWLDLLLLP